ncbi:TPA: hypothetical protein ACT9I4_001971 [Legionella pneumophila]
MRKVFRLLGIVLDAIVEIADGKPKKINRSVSEAQELFDAGIIDVSEYHDAFRPDS